MCNDYQREEFFFHFKPDRFVSSWPPDDCVNPASWFYVQTSLLPSDMTAEQDVSSPTFSKFTEFISTVCFLLLFPGICCCILWFTYTYVLGDSEDIGSILLWHVKCCTLCTVQHWDPSWTIRLLFISLSMSASYSLVSHLYYPLVPSLTFDTIYTNGCVQVFKIWVVTESWAITSTCHHDNGKQGTEIMWDND